MIDYRDKASAFNNIFIEASTFDDRNDELPEGIMIFDLSS